MLRVDGCGVGEHSLLDGKLGLLALTAAEHGAWGGDSSLVSVKQGALAFLMPWHQCAGTSALCKGRGAAPARRLLRLRGFLVFGFFLPASTI